jgi:hypothetical protein
VDIILKWIEANWFSLVQTIGIAASLCFTSRSLLVDTRIRKVSNLLHITEQHRSIWMEALGNPKLLRILDAGADIAHKPVSLQERIFVNFIILHLSALLVAIDSGVLLKPAGLDEDLRELFSLPIPNKVWHDTRRFRDPALIKYLESLLAAASPG